MREAERHACDVASHACHGARHESREWRAGVRGTVTLQTTEINVNNLIFNSNRNFEFRF